MPVYRDKKHARFRFEFDRRIAGVRYRSTKLLPPGWSQSQADAYDRTECARLYAQAAGVESPTLPLAGAVKLYLEHRLPQLRNGKKAAQDLHKLLPWIERAPLHSVGQIATDYEIQQRGKLAPATIRNRLAYLKSAVRYAHKKHQYGARDYAAGMSLPAANNERTRYERLPVLNRLWRALDPESRALFTLVFYTGLRWRAELLTRKREHIITNGNDTWLHIGQTKNGERIMKPVHPAALDSLKYIPFSRCDSYYYARWHKAVNQLGIKDFKPHDLRHSVASEILSRGGSLEDVQGALHQVTRASAERYAHLYPERLQGIMMGIGGQKNPHKAAAPRRKAGAGK